MAGGSRSGTGIGLAVVRGLVEAMGGTVAARRSDLGGLAIDIDLVRRGAPPATGGQGDRVRTPGPTTTDRRSWSSRTTTETRAALVRELASRGYRTTEADDGRSALERWEGQRPDLVLLDLGLPDIDGLDVVRRIRRDAATPIVILSGRYEEREKVEALERGADDYVTKPFGVDELNARLRVALRRAAGPAGERRRADHDRPARVRRRSATRSTSAARAST